MCSLLEEFWRHSLAGFISLPVSLTFVSASDLPCSVSMARGLGRKPCGEASPGERSWGERGVAEVTQGQVVYIHKLYLCGLRSA